MNWFKNLSTTTKAIIAIVALVLLFFAWDSGAQWYSHLKGMKYEAEYTATMEKANQAEKESAALKAEANQLRNLAKLKDAEIEEQKRVSAQYGVKAAEAAKKVEDAYNQLEKDTAVINSSSDAELRERICSERAELGFAAVGQCRGWKPKQ